MPIARKCGWCSVELLPKRDPRTRFCNSECRFLGRRKATFSEEVRQKRREQMRKLNERPDVQAKRAAFLASDCAPFKRPEIKRKSIEKQREMGFPTLKPVPGPTLPQKILFGALPGLVMEYPIAVDRRLRVDLAIPSLRLAIEVDGFSHTSRKGKRADARKEQILKERNWVLLRFWNKEILSDLSSVLRRIQATITELSHAQL
jgi:very-short-patch-repair endonuclease